MTTVEVFAPAKINLTLHVTGQRSDGYHLIDTLVAFADIGDRLTLRAGGSGQILLEGPEAGDLEPGGENLIARQARNMPPHDPLDCVLFKALPVSSGIGGGSADAAAYYRGAAQLAKAQDLMHDAAIAAQWTVGADVPMCIASVPIRASGIGELLQALGSFPAFPAVLVNARVPVATAAVFNALPRKENAPMPDLPDFSGPPDTVVAWLAAQRNDLQAPAVAQVPVIADVLAMLRDLPGCNLARMSGSGGTCFGLFASDQQARTAAAKVQRARKDWWVRATRLDGQKHAAAQVIRSTT